MSQSIINCGGKSLCIETDGSMTLINRDLYVDNEHIELKEGSFKTQCGSIVVIKALHGGSHSFMHGNCQFNTNVSSCGENSSNGKDYIINGMGVELCKNIRVDGDLIVSGVNCTVYSGVRNPTLGDLIVRGNLIVSGMHCCVGNIVQLKGKARNSGIGCLIN